MRTLALIALLIICGCSNRIMTPAEDEKLVLSPEAVEGQKVFMEYCNKCHPGGMSGLGPAIINKELPGVLIRAQVRTGLGTMPAFNEEQLAEDELDAIVTYLTSL